MPRENAPHGAAVYDTHLNTLPPNVGKPMMTQRRQIAHAHGTKNKTCGRQGTPLALSPACVPHKETSARCVLHAKAPTLRQGNARGEKHTAVFVSRTHDTACDLFLFLIYALSSQIDRSALLILLPYIAILYYCVYCRIALIYSRPRAFRVGPRRHTDRALQKVLPSEAFLKTIRKFVGSRSKPHDDKHLPRPPLAPPHPILPTPTSRP